MKTFDRIDSSRPRTRTRLSIVVVTMLVKMFFYFLDKALRRCLDSRRSIVWIFNNID